MRCSGIRPLSPVPRSWSHRSAKTIDEFALIQRVCFRESLIWFLVWCKNIFHESNGSDKKKRGLLTLSQSFCQLVNYCRLADAFFFGPCFQPFDGLRLQSKRNQLPLFLFFQWWPPIGVVGFTFCHINSITQFDVNLIAFRNLLFHNPFQKFFKRFFVRAFKIRQNIYFK